MLFAHAALRVAGECDMNAPYPGYVIEVDDESVGIVVRDDEHSWFRFYAATRKFYPLEQRHFANPHAAQRAAYAIVHAPRPKRRAA